MSFTNPQNNTMQFFKQNYIQRTFNFQIKRLVLDRKQNDKIDENALIITQDETIFFVQTGNIVTYIPYKIASNEYLVDLEFC